MNEHRFVVFDRLSGNFLGWFPTVEEAEKDLLDFVRERPSAATRLELWDDDEGVQLTVDPEKLRAATAA